MKDMPKIKRNIWTAGIPISAFHLSILNAPLQAFLRSLLFDRRKIAIVQEISTTNLIFHSCQTFECHLFVPGSLPQIYLPLFEQNSKDPKTLCQQERQRFDLRRNILLLSFWSLFSGDEVGYFLLEWIFPLLYYLVNGIWKRGLGRYRKKAPSRDKFSSRVRKSKNKVLGESAVNLANLHIFKINYLDF